MSEPYKKLEKGLAENGSFDPEKAEETRHKAVGTFEAEVKKAERCFWAYTCLCAWLFVFALFHFLHSSATKEMLFYGLLMLIFFETTIRMRLWYSIVNSRFSVLKEIKQLQLGKLPADDAEAPTGQIKRLEGPLKALSRRERAIWYVVLLCGLGVVCFVKSEGDTYWNPGTGATLTSDGCVTLAADGSGSTVTEISFVYQGLETKESFDDRAPKEAVLRFTDSRGRKLPFTMSPQNGDVLYEVDLNRSVWPGQRCSYTRVEESPSCAKEEGGVVTYSRDYSYRYGTNEFAETVVLPPGAEIVSVNPWPVAKFTLSNKPTVRFEASRGSNEPFKYTIQYRLPSESPAATSP